MIHTTQTKCNSINFAGSHWSQPRRCTGTSQHQRIPIRPAIQCGRRRPGPFNQSKQSTTCCCTGVTQGARSRSKSGR